MTDNRGAVCAEPGADPFLERRAARYSEYADLLGGRFHFQTDNAVLLRIVRHAFAHLPSHLFSGRVTEFSVKLSLAPARARLRRAPDPPPILPVAGPAFLCAAMPSANFVTVSVKEREALLHIAPEALRFAYHVRYEMLEFAAYTLAARVQRLVPLHAACIGGAGGAVLLLGASGAGKSTLALHCLLQGLDFIAEDSVLVRPRGMLATGLANFLHIRRDAATMQLKAAQAALVRRSPLIRRRSGVQKFEIDLRRRRFHLAETPLPLAAIVFVSAKSATGRELLKPLTARQLCARLASSQRYAATQPGWDAFTRNAARLPAFELRRGSSVLASVEAVRRLLGMGEET